MANWIDQFVVDEGKISIRNTLTSAGPGMRLISNPFEANTKNKLKKKKK
jgi:hypothetical protein